MMNDAASFSLKPGLNRCLKVVNETVSNERRSLSSRSQIQVQRHPHSLEQFDGLSSEAGEASVQHERD